MVSPLPANGAAAGSDDHHPDGNSKNLILDIPVVKDEMHLRGSQKGFNMHASNDKSGESGESNIIKASLRSLRETRDLYTDSIEQAADAASKATQVAVEAELTALAAVEEAVAVSAGVNRGGESWDAYAVME